MPTDYKNALDLFNGSIEKKPIPDDLELAMQEYVTLNGETDFQDVNDQAKFKAWLEKKIK